MDADCLTFQNGTLPYSVEYTLRYICSCSRNDILNYVHFLSVWKKRCELVVCSLEDAKCGVHGSIDHQDVLHGLFYAKAD